MNENSFSLIIRKIVQRGECLHINGVGEFFPEDKGACFSDSGKTLNPPQRVLQFRHIKGGQIDSAGSVLVSEYMSMKRCSEGDAELSVSEFLNAMLRELSENRFFNVPGAGVLRMNSDGDVFFVQDRNADIFPENFGLMPVDMSNLDSVSSDDVSGKEQECSVTAEETVGSVSEEVVSVGAADDNSSADSETIDSECRSRSVPDVEAAVREEDSAELYGYGISAADTEGSRSGKGRGTVIAAVSVIVLAVVAAVLVYVFREDIGPLFRHLMYSEEELEILERAGRL